MEPTDASRTGKRPVDDNVGSQTGEQDKKRRGLTAVSTLNRAALADAYEQPLLGVCSSSTTQPSPSQPVPSNYLSLGVCDQVCEFCGALFWFAERITSSPLSRRPRYNTCCRGGQLRIPCPQDPPVAIKTIYNESAFLSNIRAYNSMFSMTSFGANVDNSINQGSGPYVFKVAGQISHWLGSLCPSSSEPPRFLQMYIYDTENEIANRLRFFKASDSASLSQDFVRMLIDTLNACNDLVRLFRTARDICMSVDVPEFTIRLYHGNRQVTYDDPTGGTLGAIVYDAHPTSKDFDILIHSKKGEAQRVNKLHPLYMSLQYPLLFPLGGQGWSPDLRLHSASSSRGRQLTMNMFYTYQIHDRSDVYTLLLKGGRLFQQFLVDAYVCIEQNRLEYIHKNQNVFRSEFLQGIHDALSRGETNGKSVGKRILLPSSFTGGPRYMYKHYQDALAICRVHGNPQYFITFTCNVKWPEIANYLGSSVPPSHTAQSRPDIIARVFQLKVECLIKFLKDKKPFGSVAAELYTIEFQKRGLPHCHILLWVTPPHRIRSPVEVDRFICAEIPDRTNEPELYRIVTESMLHGPCGLLRPNSPCMRDGVCSKHFPKNYEELTHFDKNGYVYYKRSSSGLGFYKSGVPLDNGYVVPYNKTLCTHFNAHINVEYCGWSMLIKYLFKYISKGVDRAHFVVTRSLDVTSTDSQTACPFIDEIKNFVDGRYICPHEAAWRIFNFPIQHRNPAVQVLAVHLEGLQNLTFRDTNTLENVINNPVTKKTTLTEWLKNNQSDPSGRHLRYIDYLSEFWWEASGKGWIRRLRNRQPSIGRLIYIHPACGEPFFMRLLLGYQKGCTTFASIRTVSGVVFSTYRGACERLGLLGDDREWHDAFTEASSWATAPELRTLFAHLLLFCDVSNPNDLWTTHWHAMSDDITHSARSSSATGTSYINDTDLQEYILYEIEILLNSGPGGTSLSTYGLPMPNANLLASLKNRLLMEEKNYDRAQLSADYKVMLEQLNPEQRGIHDLVMSSFAARKQSLLFIYGHGGTGKTYLWTTIIHGLRSLGEIVLAVAASGIASLLLPSGRTAHSRFKIPLKLTDDSLCYIKKNTQLSQLLLEATLIIWDEAPMSDRRCIESLDRSLRDLLDTPDIPFGGKSVLLGGDFRQTLPITPKGSKTDIIASSLPKSYLWSHFRIIRLNENMRVSHVSCTSDERRSITDFSTWLLSVGDGDLGLPENTSSSDSKQLEIPPQFLIEESSHLLLDLIHFIYDDNVLNFPTSKNLSDRAIVCPKNDTANAINDTVLDMASGDIVTYLSTDSMVPHNHVRGDSDLMYPTEYLNLQNFTGIPSHRLNLKVHAPIMLLRNINQTAGLCNGTRLIVSHLLPKVIEAHVITGTASGQRVYIPRINFVHNNPELPFVFKRRQFPLKVCYAMTINKSQGQSLNKIGVYLPQPVFGHGQLYVAFSRSTSPNALKILLTPDGGSYTTHTRNIVFSEFLRDLSLNEVIR